MAQVHSITTGTPSCVEVEWLSLLIPCENDIEVSMREETASPQQWVRPVTGHGLEALQEVFADMSCAKFLDELLVVNGSY